MRSGHPAELIYGMELFSTDFDGVGGRLKKQVDDFIVEEITTDGKILEFRPWVVRTNSEKFVRPVKGKPNRFVHFIVQKMALSTLDVATILAAELKIPRQAVSYAGLKDKRAITVQRMSVPSTVVEKLQRLKLARIDIHDLEFNRHGVHVGDLWGNRFTIRLREANVDCEKMAVLTEQMSKTPLLNYFGIQRFGVTRPYTHLVGKALVKRDFEQAIRIMLTTTSQYEPEELTTIRQQLAENLTPTKEIIHSFPEDLRYERLVLKELLKHPNNYQRAFFKIPPRIQTIFVHAYQSYLFNRIISRRMRLGASIQFPEPGDFLINLNGTHSGRDSWVFVTSRNIEHYLEAVRLKKFGLAAPVPGYATKLPPSWQSDLVLKVLQEEEVTPKEFRNPETPSLDSPGGLHLVSMQPQQLETWCIENDFVIRFTLRKGSYATVVMRELMKNHPINRI